MHEDYQRTLALDNASEIHAIGMNHFEISICESHFPPRIAHFADIVIPLGGGHSYGCDSCSAHYSTENSGRALPAQLHNTLFVDLCGKVLPSAELTVFHVPNFDAVTKLRVAIRGGKRTLVGNGDPVAVDTTTRLGQSEVAHR